MKTCTTCGTSKPLDQFGNRAASPGGKRPACKDCTRAADADYRARNPTKAADWRAANKDHSKAYKAANRNRDNARNRARYAEDPSDRLGYSAARYAAKLGATIGPVDMAAVRTSTDTCYLCGQLLAGDVDADHVIPLARGGAHSMGNLRPTHASCNRSKSDTLLQDLHWYSGPIDLGQYSEQHQQQRQKGSNSVLRGLRSGGRPDGRVPGRWHGQ